MIQRHTDVRLSPTSIEMTALLVRRVLILCGGVRGQWSRTAELGENLQSAGTCDKEELHNPTGQPSAFLVWKVSHLLPLTASAVHAHRCSIWECPNSVLSSTERHP